MNSDLVTYARSLLPPQHIYANWAASALPLPLEPFRFIPPHHAVGHELATARQALRVFLGDSKQRHFIVFTSGTTASFQLLAERLPWSSGSTFICHAHAHNSLLGLRNKAIDNGARFISFKTEEFEGLLNRKCRPASETSFAVFAFPAECNLTGSRYPLEWASLVKKHGVLNHAPSRVITIVDTAKLLATSPFSLDANPDIDALVFSLYKLSATHTGFGALLIQNRSLLHDLLQRTASTSYFAGGRSVIALSPFSNALFASAADPTDFLQLGTPNMNAISALPSQLSYFSTEVMRSITQNVSEIACHFESLLKEAFPSCIIHRDSSVALQKASGTTSVTFLRGRSDSPIGHNEVGTILTINKVLVRTGCMCNTGACASVLGLSDEDIIRHYEKGHRCGDEMDLIDGKPTGVVRFSFGWGSLKLDADEIVRILRTYLVTYVRRSVLDVCRTPEKFQVASLYIYPVKGCEGSSVDVLYADGMGGVLGDRAFGIEDFQSKKIIGVRQNHEMINIVCSYDENWETLIFKTSRTRSEKLGIRERITVDVSELSELRRHHDLYRPVSSGENINENCERFPRQTVEKVGGYFIHEWLSVVLGRRVHLVRLQSDGKREKANALIVTQSELEQLGKESGVENINILRCAVRPNIVVQRKRGIVPVTDLHDPPLGVCLVNQFERFWNKRIILKRTRSCTRCQVVNIVAKSYGVESSGEPLRAIVRLSRKKMERGVVFGSLALFMAIAPGNTVREKSLTDVIMEDRYKLSQDDELQGDYYSYG